jgi:hypothetical protein
MLRRNAPIALLLLTLCACGGEEHPDVATETGGEAAPNGAAGPAPVGPVSSRGNAVDAGAGAAAGQIDFDLPPDWQGRQPSSGMRMAEATIPGPGGEGQLAVFYFGPGGGGGVQDNIQRWIDQMDPAPGSDLEPEKFTTDNGYQVTWVDVAGTLKPSTTGMGPAAPEEDARLLGAVVEGPGGPWFFKATGPDETLAAEREDFLAMLRSVRAG